MPATAPGDSGHPIGPIRVGIGLVGRAGRYLVRQRPAGTIMAGVWEFPGGKCESGESPRAAAIRECREELGFEVEVVGLRKQVTHQYPHGLVELSFFDCRPADSTVEPRASTGFRWVDARALKGLQFPGANESVLEELSREAVHSDGR
jgi:mutator protein MutT